MSNWLRSIFVLLCLLVFSSSIFAFDGIRKGFVLGGGLGFSPYAQWNWKVRSYEEEEIGVEINFLVGYAWNNHNLMVLEFNGSSYDSDFFDDYATQGYGGPVWYHYFRPGPRGFFSAIGLWRYGVGSEDECFAGWGYMIGAGYEFTKQVQIGVYMGGGRGTFNNDYSEKAGMNHVNILITVVAY